MNDKSIAGAFSTYAASVKPLGIPMFVLCGAFGAGAAAAGARLSEGVSHADVLAEIVSIRNAMLASMLDEFSKGLKSAESSASAQSN
jgi:hypothetical protein